MVVPKRLDPGSIHPTKPLRALARTPTGRDDTVLWSCVLCFRAGVVVYKRLDHESSMRLPVMTRYIAMWFFGNLSTFKYHADPVDPVIRVLSSRHHDTTSPPHHLKNTFPPLIIRVICIICGQYEITPPVQGCTSTRIPSEWELNSGAYMHWMEAMPLENSPAWLTRRGYSKT